MEKETNSCINCLQELNCLDEDPNGDKNCVCAQCRAEERHDFDKEPFVMFNRDGSRVDDEEIQFFSPKDFLNRYCVFDNPNALWIITAIVRNKDNDDAEKFVRRMTVANSDEISEVYNECKALCSNPDTTYRMYVSLNARDYVKALYDFQKKLIDVGVGLARGREDAINLARKAGSLWKTQLAQKENRATKRLLLDIDMDDKEKYLGLVRWIKENLATTIVAWQKTPNGYALVIEACDTRKLPQYCLENEIPIDIQRDSMVFVEQWKGK